jgi:hypothetical protein
MKVFIDKEVSENVEGEKIEKDIYLESDEMNFTLKRYAGKFDDKGREIGETLGFFSNIDSALRFMLKRKIKDSAAKNLSELLAELQKINGGLTITFGAASA